MNRPCIAALCVLTLALGCKSATDRANSALTQTVFNGGVAVVQKAIPTTDNANMVIESCGRPSSDHVLPIYDKMNQGPVRRIVFRHHRLVTVEFIPSHPILRGKAHGHLTAKLPADSVWRFDTAHVPHELDMVTADRLNYFLPCAANALRAEF